MSLSEGYLYDFKLCQAPHEPDDDDHDSSVYEGKTVIFMTCIHHIFRTQAGQDQELNLGLGHPLHSFHGRSSYGRRRNSSLPNIPIGLSALLLSLGLSGNTRYQESDISDYMDRIVFCHPGNAAQKLIRMYLRIEIIALQLDGEDVDQAKERLVVNGLSWIESYMSSYNSEKDLPGIDQGLLHENSISSEQALGSLNEEEEICCCCICLEHLLTGGGGATYLPCLHIYHYDCIVKWLWKSNLCPLCRAAYSRL